MGMPGLADLGMGDPAYHMWMTHTPSGVKVENLTPAGAPQDTALYDDAVLMSTHSGTHLVCLLELVWLEDLAKDKVYEFAFIAAPIKLRGATGSPTRPLALPLRAKKSE